MPLPKITHRIAVRIVRSLAVAGLVNTAIVSAIAQSSPIVNTGLNSPTSTSLVAAGRILNQATFGPTVSDILNVEQIGVPAYVDSQLAQPNILVIPPSSNSGIAAGDCNDLSCYALAFWWYNNLFEPDQLRARVTFELSKLFVASTNGADPRYLGFYLNTLSADSFGNWYDLMRDVFKTPSLGMYLNALNSAAPTGTGRVNENAGREIMQLFSIGVYALNQDGSLKLDGSGNPIPNYTDDQVQAFSLAYTGWTWANNDCSPVTQLNWFGYSNPPGVNCPMVPVNSAHSQVAKTLLRGVTLPAGQTAQQDLDAALLNLFQDPSLPPFVCRRLIQDLVESNPSPAYISRIAGVFINDGTGVRGNMKAVLRAILLDPEARAQDDPGTINPNGGRLRDPVQTLTSVIRAVNGQNHASLPNVGFYNYIFDNWLANVNEVPMGPPSVFSFYSPDYKANGTALYAPEFQIENSTTLFAMMLHSDSLLVNGYSLTTPMANEFSIDLSESSAYVQYAEQNGPQALLNFLDALLMHGTMRQDMYQTILQAITGNDPQTMVRDAIFLIVTSPQYRVIS